MVTAWFTAYLTCWYARMIYFWHCLEVSAISLYLDLFDGFLWNFAWLDDVDTLEDGRSMFLKLDFHWRFHDDFCWIVCEIAEFNAWMHLFASQETSSAESFQGDNKSHYLHVPSLLCCEKSRCHVCRGFVCFWFLLLADANNADRTLCKYL